MATQFTFVVPNQKGEIAKITQALTNANVNITGFFGFTNNNQGFISIITNSPEKAITAFNNSGFTFTQNNVIATSIENRPGAYFDFVNTLSNNNINIKTSFTTIDGFVIFDTDNNDKATEFAKSAGIFSSKVNV